jgi:energy-coupling factor transporter transmembrane protein EcfT
MEERAIAIEARAFNSTKKETSIVEIPDSKTQKLVRSSLIVGTMLLIITRVVWLS